MVKDIDKNIDVSEGVSCRAKAARDLYRQAKKDNNVQVLASWSSDKNELIYTTTNPLSPLYNTPVYLTAENILFYKSEDLQSFVEKNKIGSDAHIFISIEDSMLGYAYLQIHDSKALLFNQKELHGVGKKIKRIIKELESIKSPTGQLPLEQVNNIIISETDFLTLKLDCDKINEVLQYILSMKSFQNLKLFQDQQLESDFSPIILRK